MEEQDDKTVTEWMRKQVLPSLICRALRTNLLRCFPPCITAAIVHNMQIS